MDCSPPASLDGFSDSSGRGEKQPAQARVSWRRWPLIVSQLSREVGRTFPLYVWRQRETETEELTQLCVGYDGEVSKDWIIAGLLPPDKGFSFILKALGRGRKVTATEFHFWILILIQRMRQRWLKTRRGRDISFEEEQQDREEGLGLSDASVSSNHQNLESAWVEGGKDFPRAGTWWMVASVSKQRAAGGEEGLEKKNMSAHPWNLTRFIH